MYMAVRGYKIQFNTQVDPTTDNYLIHHKFSTVLYLHITTQSLTSVGIIRIELATVI